MRATFPSYLFTLIFCRQSSFFASFTCSSRGLRRDTCGSFLIDSSVAFPDQVDTPLFRRSDFWNKDSLQGRKVPLNEMPPTPFLCGTFSTTVIGVITLVTNECGSLNLTGVKIHGITEDKMVVLLRYNHFLHLAAFKICTLNYIDQQAVFLGLPKSFSFHSHYLCAYSKEKKGKINSRLAW